MFIDRRQGDVSNSKRNDVLRNKIKSMKYYTLNLLIKSDIATFLDNDKKGDRM